MLSSRTPANVDDQFYICIETVVLKLKEGRVRNLAVQGKLSHLASLVDSATQSSVKRDLIYTGVGAACTLGDPFQ